MQQEIWKPTEKTTSPSCLRYTNSATNIQKNKKGVGPKGLEGVSFKNKPITIQVIQQTRRDHFWEGRGTPPVRSYSWPQKKYLECSQPREFQPKLSTKQIPKDDVETSSCLSLSAEMCSPKFFPPIPPKKSTGARLQAFGSQKAASSS